MKRLGLFVTAILLCLSLSVAQSQNVERMTMARGPPAGVFGIFATGIGTYLSKNVPNLDVSVAATGGSVENVRRVNANEAEMGVSFSSDVHEAFFGLEQVYRQTVNRSSRRRCCFLRRRPFDDLRR